MKYVTVCRSRREEMSDGYREYSISTISVECSTAPIPTGLYDKHGNELMRLPDPIGFKMERK